MKLSIAILFTTLTPTFAQMPELVGKKGQATPGGKKGMEEECSLGLDLGGGKKGSEPTIVRATMATTSHYHHR
jgi:hypothetical protein